MNLDTVQRLLDVIKPLLPSEGRSCFDKRSVLPFYSEERLKQIVIETNDDPNRGFTTKMSPSGALKLLQAFLAVKAELEEAQLFAAKRKPTVSERKEILPQDPPAQERFKKNYP